MRLPDAENAIISAAKLRDYLLNPTHPANQGKVRVFTALGYTRDDWQRLADDIREQHLTQDAIEVFGYPQRRFEIEAVLRGPVGQASIMTVWTLDVRAQTPRFLTAYPGRSR